MDHCNKGLSLVQEGYVAPGFSPVSLEATRASHFDHERMTLSARGKSNRSLTLQRREG